MRTYTVEKIINVKANKVWEALKCMEQWLPQLKSITKLEYDTADDFFYEGREYYVHTPEGARIKSVIEKVDESNYMIHISAHCFILKSRLTCQVISIDENSCKIVRAQNYLGVIGSIFTSICNRREENETKEYIKVWSEFAAKNS